MHPPKKKRAQLIADHQGKTEPGARQMLGKALQRLDLAASQKWDLSAIEAEPAQLASLPLPAIIHVRAKAEGDTGHYWVMDKINGRDLELFDRQ